MLRAGMRLGRGTRVKETGARIPRRRRYSEDLHLMKNSYKVFCFVLSTLEILLKTLFSLSITISSLCFRVLKKQAKSIRIRILMIFEDQVLQVISGLRIL